MVRIQPRVSKKRYLKSKRVYTYERMSLHIPKEHHETVRPFLRQGLRLKARSKKEDMPDKLETSQTKAEIHHLGRFLSD